MVSVTARAPAKIIWFGEHFVVLGNPAIVSSINIYATVHITPLGAGGFVIESRNLGLKYDGEGDPGRLKPFIRVIEVFRGKGFFKPFHAIIDSKIPIGSGMGSSAATAVAFTAGLARFLGIDVSLDDISKIAFEAEKIVHGRPSGIDNTIATYGGFIYYEKGSFKKLKVRWPREYMLIVADTGIERSTKKAVEAVLSRYKRRMRIMERVYEAAREIVGEAMRALENGDMESLGELMNINHGLLVSIGVAIPETEAIVHNAIRYGALGAKITGAGMGGSVMILARREDINNIIRSIRKYVKKIYKVRPTSKGVRVLTK